LAFNLQNLYQIEAATTIAEKLKAPVIIQFSERFLRFLHEKYGIDYIVRRFRNQYIFFHLDHCTDLDFIKSCVDAGFDSVMYDGSASAIDINIRNSKEIKSYASQKKCLMEGELGKVSGVEDGFGDEGSSYAEIEEIERYVNETQVDLMALGIGNAHGFYESLEGLNMNILKEAYERLGDKQFFVLHGGTGLPDEIISEAIRYGVVKINLSTEIKKTTMDLIKAYATDNQLYNEISYHQTLVGGLSQLLESYLAKYTL
jgi:ketose-bisphosphate aldolase